MNRIPEIYISSIISSTYVTTLDIYINFLKLYNIGSSII